MISTYLILGKNDRVAGVAARGVGAPEVEDMLKQERTCKQPKNCFEQKGYCLIATGSKVRENCVRVVFAYFAVKRLRQSWIR